MSSKTSKAMPLIGGLGGFVLLLLVGFDDANFALDVNYIWAFMGTTIPASAAYGIFTKVFKKN